MTIKFDAPKNQHSIIKVIGVGGGGSNAVNHMFRQGIVGVNFIVCNTDAQALLQSPVPVQIQLGPGLTEGRGAGSQPEVGKNATIESIDEIKKSIGNTTKMVFITAGMGGGTGTGGAPVVAKAARELGMLTVGIVTTPFLFEGPRRLQQAQKGIEEMKESVDTLIIISNDKVRELHGNLSLSNAFSKADDVLTVAAKGIAEIITVPGYVNVDFEDVNTVMRNSGVAIMGLGLSDGEDRAMKAVKMALASPLLNNNDIRGAKHILLNITSGTKEVLMDEVADITNYIQESAGNNADIIWGNSVDEALQEKICVTVVATGFESKGIIQKEQKTPKQERIVHSLDEAPTYTTRKRPDFSGNDHKNNEHLLNETHLEDDLEPDDVFMKQPNLHQQLTNEQQMKLLLERRKRLRGLNMKLNNDLTELEEIPAYKRRNVQFEETPPANANEASKYSLIDDEKKGPEIKKRNPFLHDNPD
ncbi:MAG TPA: cell division protein FtsZ [Chitinophagales bacterium]|nr:cell division protein FtsZ [Chitinophagales bacterium]HRK28702.1 cell division protein FtsZ [Chitinophagales bacterium]